MANAGTAFAKDSGKSGLTAEQRALWDMREAREAPLDVEVHSSKVVDGCRVQEVFFTSEWTPDGPNRVFCGVAWPLDTPGPFPVLLELHGGGGRGTAARAQSMAQANKVFAIAIDWGGKTRESSDTLLTFWHSPRPGQETPTGKNSPSHRVVIACRRALDFAATQPMTNMKKVIVYGGSWGSFYSMLLSGIDPRITDTIALAGAGGWRDSYSNCAYGIQLMPQKDREVWLRTYDPLAYAGNVKADLSFVAHANDEFFWLDGVQRNFEALPGPKRMVITPNNNHGTGGQPDPIPTWPFTKSLIHHALTRDRFPEVVAGSLREEGATGRFSWRTQGPEVERAVLCFSPGKINWPSRYWVEIPARREGQLWKAQLPGHLAPLAGRYFVTIHAAQSRVTSSLVQARAGRVPQLEPVALWPGNALWDKSAGTLAWRISIDHKLAALETAGPDGIRIRLTGEDPVFEVLTNSVGLLGCRAREFAGIEIALDAGDSSGTLTVRLGRDHPRANKPALYSASVDYPAGSSKLSLPWDKFQPPAGAKREPSPFDSLILTGQRQGGKPLTVKSVELLESNTVLLQQ